VHTHLELAESGISLSEAFAGEFGRGTLFDILADLTLDTLNVVALPREAIPR